jgi:RimJ/RimL family protein N-acetyltransferase
MNVRLEQLERQDFPRIRHWIDPAVFRVFEAPVDDQQLERLLSKEQDGVPTGIGMRALDSGTGELVGVIHAVVIRRNDFAHVQQIVVDPDRRGKGYGPAIFEAFLDLCFNQHQLHRVQLFTDEDNHAAIACYKKVGFQVDGFMRDIIKTDAGYMGECVFSILYDDWLERSGGPNDESAPPLKGGIGS